MSAFETGGLAARHPAITVWGAFFLYAVMSALVVQFVVLPHLLPQLHAGHGLLVGGDWNLFHAYGVELAARIRQDGWAAWELRPHQQAPSGIAAAVYAVTVPAPFTLIPLHAALHATAGLLLVNILRVFVRSRRAAVACALPFVLFPSAMTWVTQIHKDSYFIAGSLMALYGWLLILDGDAERPTRRIAAALALIVAGGGLIWVVRPYGVPMMLAVGGAIALPLTIAQLVRAAAGRLRWRTAARIGVSLWASLLLLAPLASGAAQAGTPGTAEGARQSLAELATDGRRPPKRLAWHASAYLPHGLDAKFETMALLRADFLERYPDAASNIDADVAFERATDVVAFVPKALANGHLAPFPDQWLDPGKGEGSRLMRRLAAVEMVGVYVALLGLPFALWRWRRLVETWCVLGFCLGMSLTYALVTPNMGTLYRNRYGFLMTLVALGLAGFHALAEHRRTHGRRRVAGFVETP